MWIGKFAITHPCPVLDTATKYHVTSTGYVLNTYEENGEPYHTMLNVLSGKNKEHFIKEFTAHPEVTSVEVDGNTIYATIKGEMVAQQSSKNLFFLAPIINKDHIETWTLGATKKKDLITFYENVKKIGTIKILQLKKTKPPTFLQTYAYLTNKQRQALILAQQFGYYNNPRKITLKKLAEKVNIPRATLHEHLRKAEGKILQEVVPLF